MLSVGKKIAKVLLAQGAIDNSQLQVIEINQAIKRLKKEKKKVINQAKSIKNDHREVVFELMITLSHRQFCKLMGIKNALL